MGIYRPDGSVESTALGTSSRKFWGIYRAQIIDIFYPDDTLNNISAGSNQELIYNALILGGSLGGMKVTNIRNAMRSAGGQYNYSETTLQANLQGDEENIGASSGFTPPNQQSGDVVFLMFQDGNPQFPIIIGFGVNGMNMNGITQATGPSFKSQYNGVKTVIDNEGNYTVTMQGGSVQDGQFVPEASMSSELELKDGEVLLKEVGTAELHLKDGKVALGASSAELLQQISDQLQKIITFLNSVDSTHTHLGNLGYPTGAPLNASGFTQLATDLGTIKGLVDGIKGVL